MHGKPMIFSILIPERCPQSRPDNAHTPIFEYIPVKKNHLQLLCMPAHRIVVPGDVPVVILVIAGHVDHWLTKTLRLVGRPGNPQQALADIARQDNKIGV